MFEGGETVGDTRRVPPWLSASPDGSIAPEALACLLFPWSTTGSALAWLTSIVGVGRRNNGKSIFDFPLPVTEAPCLGESNPRPAALSSCSSSACSADPSSASVSFVGDELKEDLPCTDLGEKCFEEEEEGEPKSEAVWKLVSFSKAGSCMLSE